MQILIDNFINGNLTTAKHQAKRYKVTILAQAFIDFGYSYEQAMKTALYLKGMGSFADAINCGV